MSRPSPHKVGKKAKTAHLSADEVHVLLEDRLRAEDAYDLAAVLVKCREPFDLVCVCCNKRVETTKGCAKRWCPVCGPKVTAKRYNRIEPIARRMQWPLSVMLSMKNPKTIDGCTATLKAAFKRFRRTKFWKDTVQGGFVGFEVTHNQGTPHIHLHALVDCRWLAVSTPEPRKGHSRHEIERLCAMAQNELATVWAACLDQPQAIVWVRRADKKALAETIKYPLKPADLMSMKCRASDIIREIDKGRLVASFGRCHAASKNFLGRDEPTYVEKLCQGCLVDRSLVPRDIYNRFFDTIAEDRINIRTGNRTQRCVPGLSPRHLALMDTMQGWKDGQPPPPFAPCEDPSIPW